MYHTFDTHEIIKSFVVQGIKEEQAEVIVKAINGSRTNDLSNLVTKGEFSAGLSNLKGELKKDIADLRFEFASFKIDLIKWVVGSQIATISIILTFLKFFPH